MPVLITPLRSVSKRSMITLHVDVTIQAVLPGFSVAQAGRSRPCTLWVGGMRSWETSRVLSVVGVRVPVRVS